MSTFRQELRALSDEFGCLLIFDEVKTGAKLAWGGAQQWFKVKADIVCLAKAIGGGLPLGAFGASREIMNEIAAFRSFHAGTYASNPLATTASTVPSPPSATGSATVVTPGPRPEATRATTSAPVNDPLNLSGAITTCPENSDKPAP